MFIRMLQNDASIQQMKVAQFNAGGRPPKRKRIYQTINDRLRRVHADYGNRNTIAFLRGIAYNLSN